MGEIHNKVEILVESRSNNYSGLRLIKQGTLATGKTGFRMFWKWKSAPKSFRKDIDPNDLPIEEVWAEFVEEFRVNGVPFDRLPHAREATAWLEPPTQCPVAKAFLRFAVSEARLGKTIGDMDSFYDSGEPPQSTLIGAQSLVDALGIELWIYYEESNQEMVWKLRPQV